MTVESAQSRLYGDYCMAETVGKGIPVLVAAYPVLFFNTCVASAGKDYTVKGPDSVLYRDLEIISSPFDYLIRNRSVLDVDIL